MSIFNKIELAIDNAQREIWAARCKAVDLIAYRLRSVQLPASRELDMQDALAKLFAAEAEGTTAATVAREVPTIDGDKRGRLDFVLTFPPEAIGIECKVDGSFDDLLRQIERYLAPSAVPQISGLVVVSSKSRHANLPRHLHDKPIACVWTSRAAL